MESRKRAWAYCSIDAPEDENDALKKQRQQLCEYAAQMEFAMIGSSSDIGRKPLWERAGFRRFADAVTRGEVDILLVASRRCLPHSSMQMARLQALRIRSDETYNPIMYIMEQRSRKNGEKRHIAMRTQGQSLLSGNIFCAHCGGRLAAIHYTDSYERADGSMYRVDQVKYSCYHKSRKLCPCDGQSTYQAEKVDGMVSQTIREIFKSMSGAPEEEKIQDQFQRRIAGNRAMQKKLGFELGKNREQLTKLQMEIAKTLTGDSLFSPEDLTQAIQTVKKKIEESEIQLEKLKEEEMQKKQGIEMVRPINSSSHGRRNLTRQRWSRKK